MLRLISIFRLSIPLVRIWFIGEDETEVYSSKHGKLVSVDDAEYVEWKKECNVRAVRSTN